MHLKLADVDWTLVADNIQFHVANGFKYIETPWTVSQAAIDFTIPPHAKSWQLSYPAKQNLVGSAEQGFIQLILEERLPAGDYISAGPCFRDEEVLDDLHQQQFFKVELCSWHPNEFDAPSILKLPLAALSWFQMQDPNLNLVVKSTPDGFDIELNGIEIGSYGHRTLDNYGTLCYGTSVALPRWNMAINTETPFNEN